MNNCEVYKNISIEIIDLLENEKIDRLEELMNKREKILKEENNNIKFKNKLINEGILDLDLKIKSLLNDSIAKVKQEIKEHKLSKQASNSYAYNTNQKINIFNEKV